MRCCGFAQRHPCVLAEKRCRKSRTPLASGFSLCGSTDYEYRGGVMQKKNVAGYFTVLRPLFFAVYNA